MASKLHRGHDLNITPSATANRFSWFDHFIKIFLERDQVTHISTLAA